MSSTPSPRRIIGTSLSIRLVSDTVNQMFYAFLPIFAQGIGIPAVQMGQLVSLRNGTGLLTPLFGWLAERHGALRIIRFALVMLAAGLLVFGLGGQFWLAVVGIVLLGLGHNVMVPTLQAYASRALPDAIRARGMGTIEYAWALAGIVGLFVVGRIMDVADWRIACVVLSVGILLGAFALAGLPKIVVQADTETVREAVAISAERQRSTLAAIVATGFTAFSAIHLFGAYSTWLFETWGFEAAQLGSTAFALGIVDLIASVLVSLRLDQIGRKRGWLLASGFAVFIYALLPYSEQFGLQVALGMLLAARFCFEFAFVTAIIVLSEQQPNRRERVMANSAAFTTLMLTIAGSSGPAAFAAFGLLGLGLPSAVGYALVFIAVAFFIVFPNAAEPQPKRNTERHGD